MDPEFDGTGWVAPGAGAAPHVVRARTLCYFCCMLRLSSALFVAAGLVAAQDTALHWMPVTSAKIDVAGLPWFQENRGEFWRLPARSQDTFP